MNADRQRLLFVTLSNIGDLVMTTPVLRALHEQYPAHVIDIVADRRSSALLEACPYRGEIFHKDKRATWVDRWLLLRRLRRHVYDVIVDLRGPVLPYLLRARIRVTKAPYRDPDMHAVKHHFGALRTIVPNADDIPEPAVWISDAARLAADGALRAVAGQRCLAIAPGANWPGKIWPATAYAEMINQLSNRFDAVCMFGGPDDRQAGETIAAAATMPSLNLCGQTGLLEAAACLGRMHHFVGNDSGLGHVAAALSVPTLTVFGPGQPKRYRPWGRYADVVYAPEQDLNRLPAADVTRGLEAQRAALGLDV